MGSRDTRDKLVYEALKFFSSNDYERASLNDIARTLGVTKGAIYHYFSGKDDLFKAAAHRLLDIMGEWFTIDTAGDVPVRDLLTPLFHLGNLAADLAEDSGLDPSIIDYRNILYLFLTSIKKFPEIQNRLEDLYSGFRTVLSEKLQTAAGRGEIRPETDIDALAYEITAYIEGTIFLTAVVGESDHTEISPRVFSQIWHRIEMPEGAYDEEE